MLRRQLHPLVLRLEFDNRGVILGVFVGIRLLWTGRRLKAPEGQKQGINPRTLNTTVEHANGRRNVPNPLKLSTMMTPPDITWPT